MAPQVVENKPSPLTWKNVAFADDYDSQSITNIVYYRVRDGQKDKLPS